MCNDRRSKSLGSSIFFLFLFCSFFPSKSNPGEKMYERKSKSGSYPSLLYPARAVSTSWKPKRKWERGGSKHFQVSFAAVAWHPKKRLRRRLNISKRAFSAWKWQEDARAGHPFPWFLLCYRTRNLLIVALYFCLCRSKERYTLFLYIKECCLSDPGWIFLFGCRF